MIDPSLDAPRVMMKLVQANAGAPVASAATAKARFLKIRFIIYGSFYNSRIPSVSKSQS